MIWTNQFPCRRTDNDRTIDPLELSLLQPSARLDLVDSVRYDTNTRSAS